LDNSTRYISKELIPYHNPSEKVKKTRKLHITKFVV